MPKKPVGEMIFAKRRLSDSRDDELQVVNTGQWKIAEYVGEGQNPVIGCSTVAEEEK